jgi:hypothetical protein
MNTASIEPTTSSGWDAVLHDIAERERQQRSIIDDADETVRRHALARSRREAVAVLASSEAETAKAAAQRDLEALTVAISQAKQRREECRTQELEAQKADMDAENARQAQALIEIDLELHRTLTKFCDLVERRNDQFGELATRMGKRIGGLVIGGGDVEALLSHALACLPKIGRANALRLYRNDRAPFCFVQRDCDLFGVEIPDEAMALDCDDVWTRNARARS